MKNYTYVFYVFAFFLKIQKHDFLRFFELLHTFSRTLENGSKKSRFWTLDGSLTVGLWWEGEQAYTCSSGAVAEDRNTVWVAAKCADVELNPSKRLNLIPQPVVADETGTASR